MGATIQELEAQLTALNKNYNTDPLVITTNIDIGLEPVVDYTEIGGRAKQYFIADDTYDVYAIKAVHNKAQASADGASLMVSKCSSTTAPADATLHLITNTAFSGGDNVYKGFNLKGIAAHTVTDVTLTTVGTSLRLAAGDRLVYGCNGTLSSQQITLTTILHRVRA